MKTNKHPVEVFCLHGVNVRKVDAAHGDTVAAPLPANLVVPPGVYRYRGDNYNLERPGLYRLLCPMEDNQQRIVWRGDVYALMSAFCWLHCHGNRDDDKSFSEVMKLALTSKLVLTCGPFSKIAVALFTQLGLPIRQVRASTLEELNEYNNAHMLTEILLDGDWIVFDVDRHCLYRSAGKRLSLVDLIPCIRSGDYECEPLAGAVPFAVTEFKSKQNGYDFGLWYETRLTLGDDWLRRVMMIPKLSDEGGTFYTVYSEKDRTRSQELYPNINYLTPAEFRARFYKAT